MGAGANMEMFQQRWNTVTTETLSSVRRQLEKDNFDISVVNREFQESCAEWFDGRLAPHIWYKQLEEERSQVAQKFKQYVTSIRIREEAASKPSQVGSYVITALSLPLCYCLINFLSPDMGFISKVVLTIGIAVLVWYICLTIFKNKQTSFEEQIVDLYRQQLEEHLKEIKKILS